MSCSLAYEDIIRNKINISNKNDPIYNLKSIKNNIEIKDISTEDGDLEDVFVQLTKH